MTGVLDFNCGCPACSAMFGLSGSLEAGQASPAGTGTATSNLANSLASVLYPDGSSWSDSLGTAASVTFSFLSTTPSYASADDSYGFAAANTSQRTASRWAMALWSTVANISFYEVTDSANSDIRIGTSTQDSSSGYAYLSLIHI